jgi:hypothetical protein
MKVLPACQTYVETFVACESLLAASVDQRREPARKSFVMAVDNPERGYGLKQQQRAERDQCTLGALIVENIHISCYLAALCPRDSLAGSPRQ